MEQHYVGSVVAVKRQTGAPMLSYIPNMDPATQNQTDFLQLRLASQKFGLTRCEILGGGQGDQMR
jgi:hypothetical protein